ncbi:hypothetical protein B4088_0629 [Bacillus cereus]|uniref:Uncharacterized protein n=1 Tax=Bacillus cereus TaxID=1396 RepID=A0A164QTM4_BACCE|nr:hypothetical protein B4088_0629 [Bacillus cereus]
MCVRAKNIEIVIVWLFIREKTDMKIMNFNSKTKGYTLKM